MSGHPYAELPPESFWRSGVAEPGLQAISNLYRKKFSIAQADAVATCGSCFAQHIGRRLKDRGYRFVDFEPPPPLLPASRHREFGYSIYSARYGNVYTARQLLQLLERACGRFAPVDGAWEQNGRWFDPYRPAVEPTGFATRDELEVLREDHLARVRQMFAELNVFVFTLGLTEAWLNARDGAVYPVCPGTAAGTFDAGQHVFANFDYPQVYADMKAFLDRLREINARARVLLTVSPVPLTATATAHHVLAATTYSKSVLRAVAGRLSEQFDAVDYFPSYEVVTGSPSRGMFFESNLRSVTTAGVDAVMGHFFQAHGTFAPAPSQPEIPAMAAADVAAALEDDLVCEERILEMDR